MTPRLIATQFHGFTNSGRTSPARCGCETEAGEYAGDFVVKLTGAMERGTTGHLCELLASGVATHCGLTVPEPAVVLLAPEFVELVAEDQQQIRPAAAERIRRSAGRNFGSRQLTGTATWPVDRVLPDAQLAAGGDVFAFDALIDNPDRGFRNPNLFTRGNEIVVFDHESAFSFLLAIFTSPQPWQLAGLRYLDDHVFGRRLKHQELDLERFLAAVRRLDQTALDEMAADVPPEWNNGSLAVILDHLWVMAAHADEFGEEVRRRLA